MNKYLFKNKLMMTIFIITVPLSCLFSIKFALSFQPVIDSAINKNLQMLKSAAIWCSIYALLDCVFFLIVRNTREYLLKETYICLKQDLFSKIINMDIEDFNKENTGNYISILDNDVQLLSSSYFNGILSIYNVVISFLFSLITVLFLNYKITIILMIIAICSIIIPKLFDKRLSKLQEEYSLSMKKYTSKIKDFFEGFQVIKGFNIQNNIIQSHKDFNRIREENGYKSRKTVFFAGWISMLFSSIMYVVTYVVGGYFTIIGTMSVGLVISLSQLIGGVVAPLEKLPAILSEIYSTFEIRKKLQCILSKELPQGKNIYPNKLLSEISLTNVSFSYGDSPTNALNNINLIFKKSKKYAIVGESGSGKSTIAKIILRFYKCKQGQVDFDNNEISELSSIYLYNSISYLHQNTFLFDDTLKNNITLYNEYTDEEINNVIALVGLSDFVNKLPEGINTNIGENGNNFSGGERQRIGIARVLICKCKFLVLDESTSNLDNITANKILNSVLDLSNITTIIITHQLSYNVLSKCDYIYVMKDGSITEEGTISELMQSKSYFHNLYTVSYLNQKSN